ncbi:MAG TPA: hypothetical protein VN875_03785 [Candidatus Binatus sp.]|nr:hypothetical protein [Candidatus Binatus sp.]
MRDGRASNGFRNSMIGVFASGTTARGANVFAPALMLIIAIVALTATSSWAQSDDDSKPPAPTQSSKAAPPPPPDTQASPEPPESVMRTVTVSFNYDFSKFPPCSATVTKKCIVQFNVYEVSANKPIFLFSIPVPPNAKGPVNEITGSAPKKHAFFTGPHRFGVSAKMPGAHAESDPYLCMTFAQVLPDNPTSTAPSNAPSNSSPQK